MELAPLTRDEQAAVRRLAEDLPAVWAAETTTMADRKRLLRLAVQEVTVTVRSEQRRSAEVTVLWSGGVTTQHEVVCPPTGWHCVTDAALVERLRELAQRLPDYQIAELLNAEGVTTQTGKPWTAARVASIRKQHQIATACPLDPGAGPTRGDGRITTTEAARRLGVSPALIHVWIQQGALASAQRTAQSYRWVELSEADVARLDGQHDWSCFPAVREVMRATGLGREAVWAEVRAGKYVAYRHPVGRCWEWRLQQIRPHITADQAPGVG